MHKVLIAGAGKIGTLITCLLSQTKDYEVTLIDNSFSGSEIQEFLKSKPSIKTITMDIIDTVAVKQFMNDKKFDAIISSLPYYRNEEVAKIAKENDCHYFDLTEDTAVTQAIKKMAVGSKKAFVPQCGLAPGFITIVANHIMQHFSSLETVKLRVGALPQHTNNVLQYALTWSTDGLINQYGNLCHGIRDGKNVILQPLEDLEMIELDGSSYEAFNTSGGLGSLADIYFGKVKNIDYKTIRYPGHCEKIRILMNDLKLNDDRAALKKILEHAIPKTQQDMVIIYVSVTGEQKGGYLEENYVKKIYPQEIAGLNWTAIQVTTASGICAVVDMVLEDSAHYHGLVLQENLSLEKFLENRFGKYYKD